MDGLRDAERQDLHDSWVHAHYALLIFAVLFGIAFVVDSALFGSNWQRMGWGLVMVLVAAAFSYEQARRLSRRSLP